jgi:hydroxymethylpyrimidine/phosphomethylpyrimidine kinase
MIEHSNIISKDTNIPPVALTVAGFDPSGGAGIIADVKAFTVFGCFATAAITSLTFQNTIKVFGASNQTAETVRQQVLPVIEDFNLATIKTGMLPTREIIEEVARLIREHNLPTPVIDPVICSTSGYDLIDTHAIDALKTELFPLASIVTPNIPEAERLTGMKIIDETGMYQASILIQEMGAQAVLIKGGHLKGDAIDILNVNGQIITFNEPRINTNSTHGTGCTLAAAIAANLGHGRKMEESVRTAKKYVTKAIANAPQIGHGYGPIQHYIDHHFSNEN